MFFCGDVRVFFVSKRFQNTQVSIVVLLLCKERQIRKNKKRLKRKGQRIQQVYPWEFLYNTQLHYKYPPVSINLSQLVLQLPIHRSLICTKLQDVFKVMYWNCKEKNNKTGAIAYLFYRCIYPVYLFSRTIYVLLSTFI